MAGVVVDPLVVVAGVVVDVLDLFAIFVAGMQDGSVGRFRSGC